MPDAAVQIAQLADRIRDSLKKLGDRRVLVGIPESKAARDGSSLNNAYLAAIHENGSAVRGIPARPFLHPGVYKAQEKVIKILEKACVDAVKESFYDPQKALDSAGLIAETSVRGMFTDNDWPPNAPSTRRAKNRKHGENPDSDVTPLIDTGQLRKSISYVIVHESEVGD
ncbi:MAG: hypothetical protein LBQ42_13630 [Synergistaceae bacterium]|jgi:hypothetical protein|nr:hypothetical protein [Synergistaceae bacterium]